MPTILLSGMICADPHQGGAAWAVLQYALGLKELGYRVCIIEPISPEKLTPAGAPLEQSANAGYFRAVMREHGLADDAALLLNGTMQTAGVSYPALLAEAQSAVALLNISGMLTDPQLLGAPPIRVYLDLDPAFIQLWHAQGIDMRFAGHTHFVTVGQAIGAAPCEIPTLGIDWLKTLPPVVLSRWPMSDAAPRRGFTTIGNWRGYGSIEHAGISYGQKAHSFRQLIALPRQAKEPFEVALAIHPGETRDIQRLADNGWRLLDPMIADTPGAYQRFIADSRAEIGVAKQGYVVSRCGWFSDRSAAYLASGRPVVAQETGFSARLRADRGLLPFSTLEEAAEAVAAVLADYPAHCRAARALAEEHFDSRKVLRRLLDLVGVPR